MIEDFCDLNEYIPKAGILRAREVGGALKEQDAREVGDNLLPFVEYKYW